MSNHKTPRSTTSRAKPSAKGKGPRAFTPYEKGGGRKTYWLYGLHSARAALANPAREVGRVLATSMAAEKLATEFAARGLSPQLVSGGEIARLLPEGAVHQGVALCVAPLPLTPLEAYLEGLTPALKRVLVLLDQVTDPHNIGAILRSAAAFEASGLVLLRDHAPAESAALAKASSGGIELVKLLSAVNLAQAMELLKRHGYWCLGLDGEARETLEDVRIGTPVALVLGAEGAGLRRLTAERCDVLAKLPISPCMESLNVSNAAAIALYVLGRK